MTQIEYYFTTISPFTYLAGNRLEQIAEKHGATITYKPLDIMGLFARTGGTAPGERHPNRQAYRLQDIRRTAARLDLPVNLKPMFFPANPAPSSYAIIAAQKAGGGDLGGLVHAILRACWAEEKDVADDGVIRAALEQNGFDPGLADSGLLMGAEAYGANLEEAVARGVFGSPTYVVGDELFWGQDRLEDLDLHLAGKI
ncbi:2-hydroxychromene-2-carboxylate isomerase [Salibaculum griseiflavum]|uniref:2-hydroxychromene-2-carboxylate isomerase n=1 Tax=Salibaculum griseiflavum TaxID=1914409 RepID=A0A2V1P9I0_9RHOB|nr:2-hydroxychromene-2-carboxylate isomerase [Salibaculum griseiflavum]PWG17792.1 2-hydroxychromene-2-carboxylate isomerase [Salibaculum griseiflavum]